MESCACYSRGKQRYKRSKNLKTVKYSPGIYNCLPEYYPSLHANNKYKTKERSSARWKTIRTGRIATTGITKTTETATVIRITGTRTTGTRTATETGRTITVTGKGYSHETNVFNS
jgi:hypothetical protein